MIIAVCVVLGLVALTYGFIINARAIRRDMNRRLDEFRARLENDANSVVDDLFKANQVDDVRPGPQASGINGSTSN